MNNSGPTIDLTDAAERIHLRPGDVAGVVSRARHRTRRRRQGLSVLAAVAIVASVPVAQRVMEPDDEGTPVATSGGAVRGSLGLTWQRVDAKTMIGYARSVSTRGPLYALSSAAGERMVEGREPSRVVWRSDDGIEWDAVSTLGADLFLADLSGADDRVYAVGTAPGEAVPQGRSATLRSAPFVAGWSEDGGRTWSSKQLPFDAGDADAVEAGGVFAMEVASGPKGTVVTVVPWARLNVRALLPDGVAAPYGWTTTATGVDVLGPPRDNVCPEGYRTEKMPPDEPVGEVPPTYCYKSENETTFVSPQDSRGVKASYTFEELGVSGDLVRAARGEVVAYFAPAGSTDFSPVELPQVAYVRGSVHVEASERGFELLAPTGSSPYDGSPNEIVLLESADGRSWTKASLPTGRRWASQVGSLDGRAAFVTSSDDSASVVTADGNGGWQTVDLVGVVDPELLDGRKLSAGAAAFGPFGVAVQAMLHDDDDDITQVVLYSRDGTTWDSMSLDDVIGERGGYVSRITVTGETIVVTASLPIAGRTDGPRRLVTVVGRAA